MLEGKAPSFTPMADLRAISGYAMMRLLPLVTSGGLVDGFPISRKASTKAMVDITVFPDYHSNGCKDEVRLV
jgi:hypothetical protein